MAKIPEFSQSAVEGAIKSARAYYAEKYSAGSSVIDRDDGHLSTLAECVTLTINNGKACVNLPLGIGQVCLPIPISYNGQVASVCLSICTTWGIPTGVRVTVSVAGVTIISKTFGSC